ncbi:hypothetical protein BY996DRAFT_6419740 [Phakopsora pachyrhizi]|nr:hypothetical protein BY996DRAFT_6419740 [Phakopsora pachyrhizi]
MRSWEKQEAGTIRPIKRIYDHILQLKQNFKKKIESIEDLLTQAGGNIYKLPQSKNWLQKYPRDLTAQMISVGGKHYYIYEPVQLNDGSVVVPIFFYIRGGKLYAKS